jgi:membrane-associated phospholipid phosphatase
MTEHRRVDLALVGAGAIALAVTAIAARAGAYQWEAAIFRAVNGLPDALRPPLWIFNQYGVFLTIPVMALIAPAFRRYRMALALALSGGGVYFLAKLMKDVVGRGRPGALLDAIETREVFAPGSLGYPSGHAAVAAALTIIVTAYLSRPWAIVAIGLAVVVPLCRMYVAAHLPLDLIGGAALGVVAASAMNLTLGVPIRPAPMVSVPPDRAPPFPAGTG